MAQNAKLRDAASAKKDEFYTQYNDIEAEMNAYVVKAGFNLTHLAG